MSSPARLSREEWEQLKRDAQALVDVAGVDAPGRMEGPQAAYAHWLLRRSRRRGDDLLEAARGRLPRVEQDLLKAEVDCGVAGVEMECRRPDDPCRLLQ